MEMTTVEAIVHRRALDRLAVNASLSNRLKERAARAQCAKNNGGKPCACGAAIDFIVAAPDAVTSVKTAPVEKRSKSLVKRGKKLLGL